MLSPYRNTQGDLQLPLPLPEEKPERPAITAPGCAECYRQECPYTYQGLQYCATHAPRLPYRETPGGRFLYP